MNKITTGIFLVFFFWFNNSSFGQNEGNFSQIPMLLDTSGQWNVYQPYFITPIDNNFFFNQRIDATTIYFYNGDTIINNQLYQKIYQTDRPVVNRLAADNQYAGATREMGQQVYFFSPHQDEEVLLYDYDLEVGDTMSVEKFEIDVFEFVQVIVESIDSIQTIDQQIRKRINFSIYKEGRDTAAQYFTSWIEGIGDIGNGGLLETHADGRILFGFFDLFNGEDYTSFFQCFSKEGQTAYQSERFDECYTTPSYTPFPTENGVWRTLENSTDNFAPNVFGSTQKTRTYFMRGDTTINSQLYYQLYTTQAATILAQPSANQYVGAYREAEKTIYFYGESAEQERVLYDFNIEIGDTVATIYDDVATEYTIFLGKIDTIQTEDNQFRKRYELRVSDDLVNNTLELSSQFFSYWIEGVGDVTLGFLSFPESVSSFEGRDDFQCFSEGDNLVYQNPILDNCYTDTASYTIDYTPLVVENATWVMINVEDDVVNKNWAYTIEGDTMVNELTYKKLYYYECPDDDNMNSPILELAAILREDIAAKKVYGYLFNYHSLDSCGFLSESLLFDFGKAVGDDFSDCHVVVSEESTTIVEERLEFIHGAFRRVLTNGAGFELIEGVGYRDGLFVRPTSLVIPGYYTGLVGYKQDETFGCEIPTSITEQLAQKVNVFPNPTTNYLNLELEEPLKGQIELKSLAGQVVYSTDFYGEQHQIEVADIPKGIYFLHLQAEEGYLVRKIAIQ